MKTLITQSISKLSQQKGFGLLEVVMSLVVLGIVSLSFTSLFGIGIDQYASISARKEALSHARLAMNRMTQEFLYLKPTDLIAIGADYVSFTDTAANTTNFRTQQDGSLLNLYRGDHLLAQNLSALTLTYLDSDGNPILDGNVSNLRRIRIEIGVNAENNQGEVKIRGEVYPRNFYYTDFQ